MKLSAVSYRQSAFSRHQRPARGGGRPCPTAVQINNSTPALRAAPPPRLAESFRLSGQSRTFVLLRAGWKAEPPSLCGEIVRVRGLSERQSLSASQAAEPLVVAVGISNQLQRALVLTFADG
jgi:hypothetical protein